MNGPGTLFLLRGAVSMFEGHRLTAVLSSRYWALSWAVTKGKLQQEKQLAALITLLSMPAFESAWGWREIFPLPQSHIAGLSQGFCCPTWCPLCPTGYHCQPLCPITIWFIFLIGLYGWSELWKSKDRTHCQMGSGCTNLYPSTLETLGTQISMERVATAAICCHCPAQEFRKQEWEALEEILGATGTCFQGFLTNKKHAGFALLFNVCWSHDPRIWVFIGKVFINRFVIKQKWQMLLHVTVWDILHYVPWGFVRALKALVAQNSLTCSLHLHALSFGPKGCI